MTVVTGSLKSVLGDALNANIGKLVFRLNGVNVAATGTSKGTVYPTKEEPVSTSSTGTFSVDLVTTETMHNDAWYDIGVVWNESAGTFWDFGLKIRVPASGTHNIGDLFFGGSSGGGANQILVWVAETPPLSIGKGQWWFQPSTNNLYRWE